MTVAKYEVSLSVSFLETQLDAIQKRVLKACSIFIEQRDILAAFLSSHAKQGL